MTTATFSNGHTDTYKGKRDVKAAWALINKNTNEVIASGHSISASAAESTAKSSKFKPYSDMKWSREHGGYSKQELAEMDKANREFTLNHKVEVVAL